MHETTNPRRQVILSLLALVAFLVSPANSQEPTCLRDLWLIDTRAICNCECDLSKARFFKLDGDCKWAPESLETFLASLDPTKPLSFQLPGYWTKAEHAPEHQWRLHQRLNEQAQCRGLGCADIRHVMWLWPADKDQLGLVRDLREKAARAHFEGILLAKLLAKLPTETRVTLVGYSFGARVATSAAHHLVAEESTAPKSAAIEPESPSDAPPPTGQASKAIRLRGVLIASAVDAQWLEGCEPHSCALHRFEKILLFTNCKDRLLRRYRIVNRDRHSPALGLVGLLGAGAENALHVTQWEVSHIVGRAHDWKKYIDAPEIMSAIAEYMLFLN